VVTDGTTPTEPVSHPWRPGRFMVITAHPDDAEFGPAATAAKWIDEGSVGWLVCCTSGDKGGEDPEADPLELALLREEEQRAAAAIVGYQGVSFLNQPDGALANVALLAHPALAGRTARILDDRSRIVLLTGPATLELRGRAGDLVSLVPFGGDAEGVTTRDLQFPLNDERLEAGRARGLSNVRLGADAQASLRKGRLLVVETPATLSR